MTPGWNPSTRETPEGAFAAVHQCRRGALHFAGLPHAYQVGTRGVSVADMLARTKAAVAAKKITAPEPGSISYMLSKRQYVADATHNWHPHVMFFLPPVDATTMGAQRSGSPVYGATSDVEPVTTVLVVSPV